MQKFTFNKGTLEPGQKGVLFLKKGGERRAASDTRVRKLQSTCRAASHRAKDPPGHVCVDFCVSSETRVTSKVTSDSHPQLTLSNYLSAGGKCCLGSVCILFTVFNNRALLQQLGFLLYIYMIKTLLYIQILLLVKPFFLLVCEGSHSSRNSTCRNINQLYTFFLL